MSRVRPGGGYRATASFQTATLIYDATYWFCEKFLDGRSRMVEQMVQAARSGRQNIAEGSRAAGTSSQMELRLLNVARASLEELLLDFEDYLRHRRLPQWAVGSREARAVREVPRRFRRDRFPPRDRSDRSDPSDPSDQTDQTDRTDRTDPTNLTDLTDQQRWSLYAPWLENDDPAVRANAIICLIHQANFLLDQQIAALEKRFVEEGGYREQLAAARLAFRRKSMDQSDPTDLTDRNDRKDRGPTCPLCGKPAVLRVAKSGKNAGNSFWGCSDYPKCKGILQG